MTTTTKLGFWDSIVADLAARPFQPKNLTRAFRGTLTMLGINGLIAWAAIDTAGILSTLLWVLFSCRVLNLLMLGIAERAMDERQARLDALPSGVRDILTSKSELWTAATR